MRDHGIERKPPKRRSHYEPNKEYILKTEKKDAKKAAKELYYANRYPEILIKIDEAKDVNEIYRIMATYRKLYFGD